MSSINIKTKDGQSYKLEYTRKTFLRTIKKLKGVAISSVEDLSDPVVALTALPDLFEGAFLANHADVDVETIENIFAKTNNKNELSEALVNMFLEPLHSLVDSLESEEDEGNVSWEVSE